MLGWKKHKLESRLLFNMLSRLVITFLPRIKFLLISWLQSPSENSDVESRLQGEISVTSDMQITPLLWQKVKRN